MSAPVAVRAATPADAEAWLEALAAVVAEDRWLGPEPPLDRTWAAGWFAESLEDPAALRLVALGADGLLGSSMVEDRRGRVSLGMFVVAPARGRGVGRALLDASLGWAAGRGAHKVHLEVWPHNAAAIGLYRSAGFALEGRRMRHYRRRDGSLWDSLVMGLVLDRASPGSPHPG